MLGLQIVPHSKLSNSKVKEIVKGIHSPSSVLDRYNLSCIDKLRREGEPIPLDKVFSKDIVYKLLEVKEDSNLLILQDNFVYEIEITKNDIEFRILNKDIKRIKKLYETYIPGIKFKGDVKDYEVDIVDDMDIIEMVNKEHFMFSLKTSEYGGLEPLRYILDIKRNLEDGEKFIYQVMLKSLNNDWWNNFAEAYKKFKGGVFPSKFKLGVKDVMKLSGDVALKSIFGTISILEEIIFGEVELGNTDLTEDSVKDFKKDKGLSRESIRKGTEVGFEVGIRGIAYSSSASRREFINKQFSNCFGCLDGDNRLVKRYIKKSKENLERVRCREIISSIFTSNKMILGVGEVNKLCYLPQITLQKELNMERLDFSEIDVPKELLSGSIPIGHIYGGRKEDIAYWSAIKDVMCLSKVIVGVKGSGKSKYMENYVYHAYKSGNCCIYFDYIENNVNAREVSKHIPKEDLVVLDLGKGFTFDYPELDIESIPKDDEYERTLKRFASDYCRLVEKFVNIINTDDTSELTGNMRNILVSACSFTFLSGHTELYSIYKILTDHKFRCNVVKKIKEMGIYRDDDFRFSVLRSLDIIEVTPRSKKEIVVGTNNKADRVLDRFNALLRDSRTEEMLLGINRNNINFVDVFQQNKVVLVLMSEDDFTDYELKDIIMTYFLTRMWLSGLKRAKVIPNREDRNVVHIILDEVHQLEHSTKVMIKNIAEDRKFRTTYVFTCQYLDQFGSLWGAVKGSGSHYMLLSGTEKKNFLMLKEEIGEKFILEELINMPPRSSLNIIRYNGSNITSFISDLPEMLDKVLSRRERLKNNNRISSNNQNQEKSQILYRASRRESLKDNHNRIVNNQREIKTQSHSFEGLSRRESLKDNNNMLCSNKIIDLKKSQDNREVSRRERDEIVLNPIDILVDGKSIMGDSKKSFKKNFRFWNIFK